MPSNKPPLSEYYRQNLTDVAASISDVGLAQMKAIIDAEQASRDPREEMLSALRVIAYCPETAHWLTEHDPKALAQVRAAILAGERVEIKA